MLLCLDGTIQTHFASATYQTPVCIYLTENYPMYPPICYLRPTADMFVVPGHKHADTTGMVYLPYLSSWNPHSSNLVDLVGMMASVFSEVPPLRAKPAGATGPAPGPAYQPPQGYPGAGPAAYPPQAGMGPRQAAPGPVAGAGGPGPSTGPYRQQYPGPAPGPGSQPASPAGGAGGPALSRPASSVSSPPQLTPAQVAEQLKDELTPKIQMEMVAALQLTAAEMDQNSDTLEKLQRRGERAASLSSKIDAECKALEGHLEELESRTVQCSSWLAANEGRLALLPRLAMAATPSSSSSNLAAAAAAAAAAGGMEEEPGSPPLASPGSPAGGRAAALPPGASIEGLALGISPLQQQLINCVAEDAAIEDIYYHIAAAMR